MDKIVVIPNWVNTDNVYPIEREKNSLFDRYNLDRSKFYICYSGNIGHSQNLELLVKVAEEIQKTMPDVVFALIGEGAAKEELESEVRERKLNNIVVLPFQPYEDIAHVFSLGDVGLIISKPGIGGSSVPSKTWGIMVAERPILASFDEESELVSLISRVGCGFLSDASDSESFNRVLGAMYNNIEGNMRMGKAGRKYVMSVLSKDKCVKAYVDVIKESVN